MSRPVKYAKKILRPPSMQIIEIDGIMYDPWLPIPKKLSMLATIAATSDKPADIIRAIELHNDLVGDGGSNKEEFQLRIKIDGGNIENRETKPFNNIETK